MMKFALALIACLSLQAAAQSTPPWSGGRNDPAPQGFVFHVPDIDNMPDLHGDPIDAKLVLFIGGNQFFVLPKLIAGFEKLHPELAGHIFYETLPPGVLVKQMQNGNTVTLGNLTIKITPDIFEAGAHGVSNLASKGRVEKSIDYVTNDLEIMVAAGNPKHIATLNDLAHPGVTLSMPNPEFEGVARQIEASLTKAGGPALETAVYKTGVANGTTVLTQIHHRQTAMRILRKQSDAGVVWSSEVEFQQKIGNPLEGVKIPAKYNTTAVYSAALLKDAPHREAALAWLAYLKSPEAQAAYHEFGFRSISSGVEQK
jgi:ABC-type molybdate transport system substrate-binding protein